MLTLERLCRSIVVAALLLGTATAPNSTAQAQHAQETAAARALFSEGVELADTGDWTNAEDRFRRAHALRPSPVIAFNWLSALEQLGRVLEASELARGILKSPEADADLIAAAKAKLEALEPRLAHITLRVTGSLDGVSVALDGREVPRPVWGVETPADPGDHQAVATREGDAVAEATLAIAEGERAVLALEVPEPAPVEPEPAPVVAEPTPPPTKPEPARKPLYKNPWLWAAVGVVVVAGGVTGGVLAAGDSTTQAAPNGNTTPGVITF